MPPAPPTDPYVKYSLIRFVSTRRKASDPGRSQPRRLTRCCPQLCSAICASRVDTGGALKVAPVFPSPRGHARLRLPAAFRPVSWVPWASVPHASGSVTWRPRCLRYYASLRLPSSVPAGSLFGSRPVPWVDALGLVFLPACTGFGSFTARIQQRTPGCWLSRSPVLRH